MPIELLRPDWAAPRGIVAAMSTRRHEVDGAVRDDFDLGAQAADAGDGAGGAVAENRRRFAAAIGARPAWLQQVHGSDVVRLRLDDAPMTAPCADASVTTDAGLACTVRVADCLPVLMCSADGRAVAAAHAGWRGLAAGVLERTVEALCGAAECDAGDVLAWLGPCIGPRRFEVGADVLLAFGADPDAASPEHFVPQRRPDGQLRWLADLPALARARLAARGVQRVSGGDGCTVDDRSRFFSFRRDGLTGPTGRMAAAIAIVR